MATPLGRSLAWEWAASGVRVNSISPGYTYTPMTQRPEQRDAMEGYATDTPLGRNAGFATLATALERHVSAAAAAARSPFSLWDTGELRDLLEDAGLRNLEVHSRTRMLCFPPPAEFIRQYV